MKINLNKEDQVEAEAEPSDSFLTFGGEYWDGEYHFQDYGLDLGSVSIYHVKPKQYMSLGLSIINHLMTNGYDFSVGKDYNGAYIKDATIYRN